jgi:hypothetical protein
MISLIKRMIKQRVQENPVKAASLLAASRGGFLIWVLWPFIWRLLLRALAWLLMHLKEPDDGLSDAGVPQRPWCFYRHFPYDLPPEMPRA